MFAQLMKKQAIPLAVLSWSTYYYFAVSSLPYNDKAMINIVYYIMLPLFLANLYLDFTNMKDSVAQESDGKKGLSEKTKMVFTLFGVTIVYLFSLNFLGFVLPTMLFLAACLYVFGVRNGVFALGYSVFLSAGLYLIFAKLFMIPLPRGIIGL